MSYGLSDELHANWNELSTAKARIADLEAIVARRGDLLREADRCLNIYCAGEEPELLRERIAAELGEGAT